jgi:hypothetical protein
MMSGKILSRLNRRTVLVVVGLVVLLIGFVLYFAPQKPIEERLSGHTWCLLPFSPFLKWTFNKDGSFIRQITIPGEYDATRYVETGMWSIYEKDGQAWIRVVYDGTQEEALFSIKAAIRSYLRLGGDFKDLGKAVSLYRCTKQ